ncbi:YadA C-terminal domain-containing protein [Dendrosporobacter sp. 1207_IL3150]|uniref:YadA C-terminal domain-containing protein n=1 Tax=Dendrosporobacter sp. 1207_IL3150 TaxID=3084054 RepID=UPI002FDAE9A0
MSRYKGNLLYVIVTLASVLTFIPNNVWADTPSNQTGPINLSINVNNNVGTQVVGGENLNLGVGAVVSVALGDSNTAVATGIQVNSQDPTADYNVGIGSVSSGGGNNATGAWTTAIGYGNTALGAGATATAGVGSTALGAYSYAYAPGSVALGAGSIADRPDTVSVGHPGYERQITNVAPGYYDTDAVNMSQLRSLDSKVERVGAMAFALSALAPMPYDPKDPTQYSAGIGTYNGEGAIALGVYHYSKPTVMYNAAIAMSGDGWEKSARAGITWRTGGAKPKVLVPAVSPIKPEEKNDIVSKVNKILAEYEK